MSKRVMQWDLEDSLSEYSDRIVQDSHLIPFSYLIYALGTAFSAHFYYRGTKGVCQYSFLLHSVWLNLLNNRALP